MSLKTQKESSQTHHVFVRQVDGVVQSCIIPTVPEDAFDLVRVGCDTVFSYMSRCEREMLVPEL